MKSIGLYGLIAAGTLCASPSALAAEQQSLEKKVTLEIQEINELYIEDSYSRILANCVKEMRMLLKEAREKNIDVWKEYSRGSDEELLRTKIVLGTISATHFTIEALRSAEYRQEFTEPVLAALHITEKAFGNHPSRYPLLGRQKLVMQLLAGREPLLGKDIEEVYRMDLGRIAESVRLRTGGKGYSVPEQYRALLSKPIESYEHWSINYTRLDEISLDRQDCVPPEYKEEHRRSVLKHNEERRKLQ